MGRRQTRRAVSIAGVTYARISSVETNIAGYLERLIAADLDARGVPVPDKLLERRPKTRPETVDEHIGTHFTF
jgi:hypothetical protein